MTGAALAHSQGSDETAVVVVPDGENCTELRSESSGRDLNAPTSRRTRRALLPVTVDAPARGLNHVIAAAVVGVGPG